VLSVDDLQFCAVAARKAVSIYNGYDAFPDRFPRSVDSLRRAAYNEYHVQFKIQYPKTPTKNGHVVGYYLYEPSAHTVHIFVDAGLNPCWRRLVQCKEMFQFILDRDADRTIDVKKHVSDMSTPQFPFTTEHRAAVASEFLASVAAMEFLLPYTERVKIVQSSAATKDVAEAYKVPEAKVSNYLSESYMKNLGLFFK
jgi:hypothetical protein